MHAPTVADRTLRHRFIRLPEWPVPEFAGTFAPSGEDSGTDNEKYGGCGWCHELLLERAAPEIGRFTFTSRLPVAWCPLDDNQPINEIDRYQTNAESLLGKGLPDFAS